MSKFVVKTVNLSLIFIENQHLKGFSPIMKVPFQRTKREDTLLRRSFSISCDSKTFHCEIDHLKTILIKSNYPLNFIDLCIKSFINELYTPKVIVPNVPKRNVFVKLAILESTSFQIRKKLKKLFSDNFKVRICEHLGMSHLTGKKVKIDNNKLTAIQERLLCCNYSPSFEDFPILTRESDDFKPKIMDSILIARHKPILNKADSSLLLELF